MLGSVGVIAAALVVMATGWRWVDPLVGAGIGLFIVPRTWRLLSERFTSCWRERLWVSILPRYERRSRRWPGVRRAYDLHAGR